MLGLALLTLVAAVVPLVAGAGARRTATSLERMRAELGPYDLDVQFDDGAPDNALEVLRSLPGVEHAAEGASILARPVGSEMEEFQAFGQGGLDELVGRAFERPRLDAGRLPVAADEVLLSTRLARQLGLGVGQQLELETFTPEAIDRIFAGEPATYDGPRVSLEIVGVGRQPEELTGGADYPAPLFVVGPAFFEAWAGEVHWFDGIFLVQLTDGLDGVDAFTAALRAALPDRDDMGIYPSEEAARVGDAVSTQATALALLALAAIVTAGLALAQAAIRMTRSVGDDVDVLTSIGFTGRDVRTAAVLAVALPVVVGLIAAIGVAIALSPMFPTGPAGRVEPDAGLRVDAVALGVGTLVLLAGTIVATARFGRRRTIGSTRPSNLAGALAGAVPSVSAATGIRAALRPDRGPTAIPARSAMVALGAGVAGLVAALVFGASLDRLVASPARYGWNWDYEVALGDLMTDAEAIAQARQVLGDPRLDGALYARTATRQLAGRPTVVMGVQSLTGDIHNTIVAGRDLRADDEIVVGKTTLELLGHDIGDEIPLPGDAGPRSLRIVGQALFPSNENEDPAAGAAVTLATLEHLPGTGGFPSLYVTARPESDSAGLAADLEDVLGFATGPVAPPVISNLELIDESPYLLAGYLGVLGAAVSAHAVLMTIRQRRGELATLKSLGFARHQVGGTVLAQSLTVAVIGTLAGIPLGLAGGRLAWRLVAGDLGFAVDPKNPVAALAAVAPATLLLVTLIAVPPAWWVARAQPATALRSE